MKKPPLALKFILLGSAALAANAASAGAAPPPQSYIADSATPPASPAQISTVKSYSPFIIGQNNPRQNVLITGSGAVFASGGVAIGQNATSDGNLLTVDANGTLNTLGTTYVGDKGAGNALVLNPGSLASLNEIRIGNAVGSDGNSLLIESNLLNYSSNVFIGYSGSSNQLTIDNGGYLFSVFAMLGNAAGSSFNTATVAGPDSRWAIESTYGGLFIGMSGDDNSVTVTDDGVLLLSSATSEATHPEPDIVIGGLGGSRNSLFIGYSGSVTHPGDILIGENGTENQMNLYFSGALATGGNAYIGGGPDYSASSFGGTISSADDNSVVVDGLATSWTVGGAIQVGAGGRPSSSGNSLSVQYGGHVSAAQGLYIGMDGASNDNRVMVFGQDAADIPNPSLLETTDIRIGLAGNNVEASDSSGNMLMAGSEDPGAYIGTISAGRILVGNGNTLGLGGGGVFTVGDVIFGSASDYLVHVNSTARGSLAVSGTAYLGGTVRMSFGDSFDNRFVILDPAVVDGEFAGLDTSNLSSGLTASLEMLTSVDETEAAITFVSAFADVPGLDANQIETASAIDAAFNSGSSIPGELATAAAPPPPQAAPAAAPLVLQNPLPPNLGPLREELKKRLSAISGEVGAGSGADAVKQSGRSFLALLSEGGAGGVATDSSGMWGSAFGATASTAGDEAAGSSDTDTQVIGIASGRERQFGNGRSAGLAIAGGATRWQLDEDQGTGESTFLQLGAYGTGQAGPAYAKLAAGMGLHAMSTHRDVSILRSHEYDADFTAAAAAIRVESGYRLEAAPTAAITPFVALEGHHIATAGYDEDAASGSGAFALSYASASDQSLRSEVGFNLDLAPLGNQGNAAFSARVAWTHEWTERDGGEASFQSIENTSFTVAPAEAPADLLLVGASVRSRLWDRVDVTGRFTGEFGDGYESFAGAVSLDYAF